MRAKKTQRDKDWPMIRRLLEAHYFQHRKNPSRSQQKFWLLEMRTPSLLIELAKKHPRLHRQLMPKRPLVQLAVPEKSNELELALHAEEAAERERDKLYWLPLRRELEKLRHPR